MSLVLASTSRSQTDEVRSDSSSAEETEPDQLLGSKETQVAQMETNHETIPPEGVRSREAGDTGRLKRWADRHGVPYAFLVGIAIIIGIGIGIGIDRFILSAKQREPCPDSWVGYLGKCYYFPEAEANWTSSKSYCSALGASLAGIDTQQEMIKTVCFVNPNQKILFPPGSTLDIVHESSWELYFGWLVPPFSSVCQDPLLDYISHDAPGGSTNRETMDFMMRYGGPNSYWIGLHRKLGQPWKWTNGTEFNNWFAVAGGELCAFMNHNIASSSCSREGRWICSKRAEKTEGKAK